MCVCLLKRECSKWDAIIRVVNPRLFSLTQCPGCGLRGTSASVSSCWQSLNDSGVPVDQTHHVEYVPQESVRCKDYWGNFRKKVKEVASAH